MRKVLIAVSGTGGHVYPGIALAEELRARHPDLGIRFAAARGKPGIDWIRAAGFEVGTVPLRGFARRPGVSWLVFPFALVRGTLASLAMILREKPALVVGTGGYVSGPFVAFAALLRIPTLVLEQNAIPGVATKLGALFAREVHVADPGSVARLPGRGRARARVSGNPVRLSVEKGDGARFRRELGLTDEARPIVLVLGGSQGAQAVTEAALDAARLLPSPSPLRVVVQAGARGIEAARERAAGCEDRVTVVPFLDSIGDGYAAADLVVARAGAMTLAELGAAGVPSVLVPYPYAAEDHQTLNARRYAAGGAAVVVDQSRLTPAGLAELVQEIVADPERRRTMSEAARRTEGAGARERIAKACEAYLPRG
jgi:UDP-N-acetylglucosamine--N-acetylmuramyl-(pentapeptide) pyrophosphoryl-undecaprenol N-acetylglucosamine transferase